MLPELWNNNSSFMGRKSLKKFHSTNISKVYNKRIVLNNLVFNSAFKEINDQPKTLTLEINEEPVNIFEINMPRQPFAPTFVAEVEVSHEVSVSRKNFINLD
ncbi:11605_t:CDS:2, partial [Entrophospora sp. SA101]